MTDRPFKDTPTLKLFQLLHNEYSPLEFIDLWDSLESGKKRVEIMDKRIVQYEQLLRELLGRFYELERERDEFATYLPGH